MNLDEVIEDVLARFDLETAARIRIRMTGEDFTGEWDRLALDRVISNLLGNALKYSSATMLVQVALVGDDEAVEFKVRDEGIGLEPKEVAGLFKRYSRSRAARERHIHGVGLGLYLSCELVVALGGEISAESAGRDRGASFTARLPRGSRKPTSH